jgi:hypothetical protein
MALGPQFDPDKLYHGTAGEIEGGVVRPNRGQYGFGAYAVYGDDERIAQSYASRRAAPLEGQQRLFGTVYEVTPRSKLEYSEHDSYVSDPEGLNVVKAVDFPPNSEIKYAQQRGEY